MTDNDIVNRLRDWDEMLPTASDALEAADEITRLRADLAAERENTSVARQSLYEVVEQRNAALYRIAKLREALERAVVRIKSLQGHDLIDPAIDAVLAETGDDNGL